MRQFATAVAVATTGLLLAACGSSNGGGTASTSSTTTTATASKPPLAQAALANVLLTPAEIDSALGVTGSKSDKVIDQLNTDNPADLFPKGYKFPDECIYITGTAEGSVYAGSGNIAVHGERDSASIPGSDDPDPDVSQVVVLFPSAKEANAFFTSSAQRWPACANRQDTVPGDADTPDIAWKVGPVSNTNGVLSTSTSVTASRNGKGLSQSCQRALTVRNNAVIDVEACRKDPANVAVDVANQIAGKVDKQ
ncbi:sensor domain-containing protein [Mycobacterium sp. Aquia_216]|uniref:sensor domain-containing protein n=1 Tax=Mycobacterium sp. Aquia_216 TaxID=2991729 RepID=UPI00227AD60D|nr:sensor domain-containing protein [Mycobacterium sp. Aquia_216]WAJ43231.1 sensor domain-containing protein [Mycobacterium sp. Aquia_216]